MYMYSMLCSGGNAMWSTGGSFDMPMFLNTLVNTVQCVCMCHDESLCCSCYTQRGDTALDLAKQYTIHDVVAYLEEIGEYTY